MTLFFGKYILFYKAFLVFAYLDAHWMEVSNSLKRKGEMRLLEHVLIRFLGHSDAIRDLCVQGSEHVFLSASRDKTVKLWLLSNHGDGGGQSACSWTSHFHQKPVFGVDVIDVTRQAVSCDGTVHVSISHTIVYTFKVARALIRKSS